MQQKKIDSPAHIAHTNVRTGRQAYSIQYRNEINILCVREIFLCVRDLTGILFYTTYIGYTYSGLCYRVVSRSTNIGSTGQVILWMPLGICLYFIKDGILCIGM